MHTIAFLVSLITDVSANVALDGPALLGACVAAAFSVTGNVLLVVELRRMRRTIIRLEGELSGLREAFGMRAAAATPASDGGPDGKPH